ncbi:unnamed protein product [Nippostrongylus brasiliensis]|uniref:Integrase core domain containing protein n=1 Tax=Nippostrongylus brasiliensis TaxID=27835 RepID=A0A0N4Y0R0_NIPBR|nr:unnamed protein product [Nippostrongylus brasiliensis]
MPSAGINPKEFRQTQPLVIMRALEGEIKHNLDLEKSVEISDIKFDPALNEITHIGSNIDRFDVSVVVGLLDELGKPDSMREMRVPTPDVDDKETVSDDDNGNRLELKVAESVTVGAIIPITLNLEETKKLSRMKLVEEMKTGPDTVELASPSYLQVKHCGSYSPKAEDAIHQRYTHVVPEIRPYPRIPNPEEMRSLSTDLTICNRGGIAYTGPEINNYKICVLSDILTMEANVDVLVKFNHAEDRVRRWASVVRRPDTPLA